MTAEMAPGQAWGAPAGPAEPGPARPSLPDRMARDGIWLAVITRILLHDRVLQCLALLWLLTFSLSVLNA